MAKVLVTGGSGMLGGYVSKALEHASHVVVLADRAKFDLADPDAAYDYVLAEKPAAILHLAAETNVDLCELNPQQAGIRNHLSTASIAKAAEKSGAWMLYVSTSNVFGERGSFEHNELDLPSPVNYYGRSKLMGEYAVRQHCPLNHLIVRAGWMIGGGASGDHKFVGKLIQQIREGAVSLRAVGDKFGSITRASLLSDFIVWALESRCTGTLHYTSKGTVTRFNIAQMIGEIIGKDVVITSVKSSDFPLSAPRPFSEGMSSIYTPLLTAAPQPGNWRDDLASYVATFLD
ncbi:dTDP-4-dehydrorhamnose reductase [Mesorhizobium sp. LSJC268A00]|uniref:SDR family oxidoreductase n=1 Tax=unclassified Mesorhizobium TaxID=325217 RepID=UPI0003CDE2FC|nr:MULTISPECIES: SDR family oxidoreductase [unclassified Mesorhizobium]ESX03706.1 dTDP-4-dehydrorhamnose reductase [Mesorhizobium sp. LSJC268A00]ESZ10719.1 dTDP-4-dehydrorhamnose reductase [Mesorhizobium sp. L2C085B000]ESZ51551.1 dTDP-4-dehydrorhamnose reductase [Mesorhizobium sp. L2C054A000]